MNHTRLFGCLVASCFACGPSVPEQIPYRLLVEDGTDLRGTTVTLDGAEVGVISAADALEFTTPSSVRPSALNLALMVNTQCGVRSVPLELQVGPTDDSDETIGEAVSDHGTMVVRASVDLGELGRAKVYVDRGEDTRPLRIGQATLPAEVTELTLIVDECETDSEVRVGDELIGTWHASSTATLVSLEPVCHRIASVGYGNAVQGRPIVFGQRVRALGQVPEYMLRNAPSSVSGRGGEARYVTELVRTECPTGRPAAEVAAGAFEQYGCAGALPALRRAVHFDQDDLVSATRFVSCLSVEREAVEAARDTLSVHPEARAALATALREAGHESAAASL